MTSISYTSGLPDGNQTPASQRPSMQTNNDNIDTLVARDHFGFNINNGGFHEQTTFIERGSDPTPNNTFGAQNIAYSKTVNAIAELFLSRFGSATPVQMSSGTIVNGASGQSFLPGNIKIKWGSKPAAATGTSIPIVFTTAGLTNFDTGGYVAFAIGDANGRIYQVTGVSSTTGFTVGANTALGAGDNFFWCVIGS